MTTKPKIKPANIPLLQFVEWGRKGGQASAKTNSKRLKKLHAKNREIQQEVQEAVDK